MELHVYASRTAQSEPGPLCLHVQWMQAPRWDTLSLYCLWGKKCHVGCMIFGISLKRVSKNAVLWCILQKYWETFEMPPSLFFCRIMISASLAITLRAMCTRWINLDWVLMTRATTKLQPPLRTLATRVVSASSVVSSHWCMRASVAMLIALCRLARRWRE